MPFLHLQKLAFDAQLFFHNEMHWIKRYGCTVEPHQRDRKREREAESEREGESERETRMTAPVNVVRDSDNIEYGPEYAHVY